MKKKTRLNIELDCFVDEDTILEVGTLSAEDLIKVIGKDKKLVITNTKYKQYSDKLSITECKIEECITHNIDL